MADTVEKFCAKRFAREKILFSPTSSFPDDTIDKAEETAGTRRSSAFRRRTAGEGSRQDAAADRCGRM